MSLHTEKLLSNKLSYREATKEDIPHLQQLGIESYSPFKEVLTTDNWNGLNTFLHDIAKWEEVFNKSTCFVCVDDGAIVGMAFLVGSGNAWDIFRDEWSYIRLVGVHPQWQGRGIARHLMQMCIAHARQTGEKTIALHTSEFMNAARHIYENLGFKVLEEIPARLGKRYWLYTLEL
jgi:GNAT superfamily N-acetyltransferase